MNTPSTTSPALQKKKRHSNGLLHRAAHDPRAAALHVLTAVVYRGEDSQAALDEALQSALLMPTDKRFCTELVYGALRAYLRLESFLQRFLKNPDKLPEEMKIALLMASYELLFLRVPPHATVNWTVGHIRNRFGKELAGVANGVLRNIYRQRSAFKTLGASLAQAEDTHGLSAAAGIPEWIVAMWLEQYGLEATRRFLITTQHPAPTGLRINQQIPGWKESKNALLEELPDRTPPTLDASTLSHDTKRRPTLLESPFPCVLAYTGSLSWQAKELLKSGKASRQSAASYEVLFSLIPETIAYPVWDTCSGRGGKTLALLEAGIPVALATDTSLPRLQGLIEEYSRLGLQPCIAPPHVFHASAINFFEKISTEALCNTEATKPPTAECPKEFGMVIIDAPCSGFGTLSRHPEIRLRRTPHDINELIVLQKDIIETAWAALKPGGSLIYLTCTINKAENEEQVEGLLERHPEARLEASFQTPLDKPWNEFFFGARIYKPHM